MEADDPPRPDGRRLSPAARQAESGPPESSATPALPLPGRFDKAAGADGLGKDLARLLP